MLLKYFLILCIAEIVIAGKIDPDGLFRVQNNIFSARLFNIVMNENKNNSVVMSAFSVLTPLAQLCLGASGASHNELLQAIGMHDDKTIKIAFEHLSKKIQAVPYITLKMANRIYVEQYFKLDDGYKNISKEIFNSDVKNIDFVHNYDAAASINSWVEIETNHHIKNLIDPKSLDASTRLIIVNAIYFKGLWKNPFDKRVTVDSDFHVSKNDIVQVPMMYTQGTFEYYESAELDAQILKLPYTFHNEFLLVILPKTANGLPVLLDKLKDPTIVDKTVQKMTISKVKVYLPKFKVDTTINLVDVLHKMGVNKIFNGNLAHLYKIMKETNNLYVSSAIHKAVIEVNEEGVKGGAANAAVMNKLKMAPSVKFNAKWPFYFEINAAGYRVFEGVFLGK